MRFCWRFRKVFAVKRQRSKGSNNGSKQRRRLLGLRHVYEEEDEVLSWDNIISSESFFEHLSSEAKLLWTMYGGDRGNARSFWISKKSTPQCALELFAQKIAYFHCSRDAGANHPGSLILILVH